VNEEALAHWGAVATNKQTVLNALNHILDTILEKSMGMVGNKTLDATDS
jgi:hypothetical protein